MQDDTQDNDYMVRLAISAREFVGMVIGSVGQAVEHEAEGGTSLLELAQNAPLVQQARMPLDPTDRALGDFQSKSMTLACHAILAVAMDQVAAVRGEAGLEEFIYSLERFCGAPRQDMDAEVSRLQH